MGIGAILFIIIVLALVLAFEIWMFVDALKNKQLTDMERLLWCIGMLLIHPFVAIIYYFVARPNRA